MTFFTYHWHLVLRKYHQWMLTRHWKFSGMYSISDSMNCQSVTYWYHFNCKEHSKIDKSIVLFINNSKLPALFLDPSHHFRLPDLLCSWTDYINSLKTWNIRINIPSKCSLTMLLWQNANRYHAFEIMNLKLCTITSYIFHIMLSATAFLWTLQSSIQIQS